MQNSPLETINRIVVRRLHNLLQYLPDAWPWAQSADQVALLARLRKIIDEDKQATGNLIRFLRRHRTPVGIGQFPDSFTTIHYLGLDCYLPRLIAHQKWSLRELEEDLQELADGPAQDLALETRNIETRHLSELDGLIAELKGRATSTRK